MKQWDLPAATQLNDTDKFSGSQGSNIGDDKSFSWLLIKTAINSLIASAVSGKANQADIDAINELLGSEAGDGDSAVNKLKEALVILQNFAEGSDVASLINGKQNKGASQKSGSTIVFLEEAVYGTRQAPISANLQADVTGALPVVVKVIHQSSIVPTLPSSFKKVRGSADYQVNTINYIYLEYVDDEEITYSITQTIA